MYSKFNVILIFFITILIGSCNKDSIYVHPQIKLENSGVVNYNITASSNHLAFPDLIRYNDKWFLTYREGDGHLYKDFSKIIVLISEDFVKWNKLQELEISKLDLRDPKFSFNSSINKLYIHFHGIPQGTELKNSRSYYCEFSDNDMEFDIIKMLRLPDNLPNKLWECDWLWKPLWYKSKFYVNGYLYNGIRTYSTNDLSKGVSLIGKSWNIGWSEAASIIKEDTLITVVRTNGLAKWGKTSLKNIDYEWGNIPINDIGGPNLIHFNNNSYFIAGRQEGRFEIFNYDADNNNIISIFRSNSISPDIGYNGMFLHNNKLYAVYYEELPDKSYVIKRVVLNLDGYE